MSNNGKIIKLDQANIDLYSDPTEKFFLLKESEAIALLSQVPYLSWSKRWVNLSYTQEEINQFASEIADSLMNPVESAIMDCNDVEACLPTSATILSIGEDITTAQTTADTAQATASTAQTTADTAQAKADELEQNSPTNEYPTPPTISQPDRLCQVTDYISKELRTDIITIIDGTLFNSYIDGVKYFMSIGGYNWTSISALIQLIFASVNVNLETEILDARSEVHEILYCNEMDFTQSAIDIDASGTISADAKTCYTAIMSSWTASKKALIASIGEANAGADCSAFCPSENWLRLGGDGNANMAVIPGFVYGDAVYNATLDRYESPATGEVNNAYTQCWIQWVFGQPVSGSIAITVQSYRTRSTTGNTFYVYTQDGEAFKTKLAQDTPQTFVLGLSNADFIQLNVLATSNSSGDGRYALVSKIDITPS